MSRFKETTIDSDFDVNADLLNYSVRFRGDVLFTAMHNFGTLETTVSITLRGKEVLHTITEFEPFINSLDFIGACHSEAAAIASDML